MLLFEIKLKVPQSGVLNYKMRKLVFESFKLFHKYHIGLCQQRLSSLGYMTGSWLEVTVDVHEWMVFVHQLRRDCVLSNEFEVLLECEGLERALSRTEDCSAVYGGHP